MAYFMGLDVGGTSVKGLIIDETGKIICEDSTPTLVVSTASPFKFCDNVLSALGKKPQTGIDVIPQLSETTGVSAPPSLAALKDKTVRFHDSIQRDAMPGKVCAFLNGG